MNLLVPFRGRQTVKFNFCQRWWAALARSGSGGAAEEGESTRAREIEGGRWSGCFSRREGGDTET